MRARRHVAVFPALLLQFISLLQFLHGEEVWQKDLSEEMTIGVTDSGYRRVELRCAADFMQVDLELDEEFDGVIYTRGSFYTRESPCFTEATGGRNFTLRVPLDACNTKKDDELYVNTIVLQYDRELIMPGDMAFRLECDFRKPRDVTVVADLPGGRTASQSRISLEDADPAAKDSSSHGRRIVTSVSDNVILTPIPKKDEL